MKRVPSLIFFLFLFSQGFLDAKKVSPEELKQMQETDFLARKDFGEGLYESALEKFEKILSFDPDHVESKRMIALCREKLGPEPDLNQTPAKVQDRNPVKDRKQTEEALKKYNNGDIRGALELLRELFKDDRENQELKNWLSKILIEMSVEHSLMGDAFKATEYLTEAQRVMPENEDLEKMIGINRSMQESAALSPSRKSEGYQEIMSVFEKYHTEQEKFMGEYMEEKSELQKFIRQSESERKKLSELLTLREKEMESILLQEKKKDEKDFSLIQKNIFLFAGGLLLVILVSFYAISQIRKVRSEQQSMETSLSRKADEYFEKAEKKSIPPREKKLKKIEIIEKEFSAKDFRDKDTGMHLLAPLLEDPDYPVRIRSLKALFMINPMVATDRFKRILATEEEVLPFLSSGLLEELVNPVIVDYLFTLSHSDNPEIKKAALDILIRIFKNETRPVEIRAKIKSRLDQLTSGENWILL